MSHVPLKPWSRAKHFRFPNSLHRHLWGHANTMAIYLTTMNQFNTALGTMRIRWHDFSPYALELHYNWIEQIYRSVLEDRRMFVVSGPFYAFFLVFQRQLQNKSLMKIRNVAFTFLKETGLSASKSVQYFSFKTELCVMMFPLSNGTFRISRLRLQRQILSVKKLTRWLSPRAPAVFETNKNTLQF